MVIRGNLRVMHKVPISSGRHCVVYPCRKDERKRPLSIITPQQGEHGHDEDISKAEIITKELATEQEWNTLASYTLQLFERGKSLAAKQGLILADTKYEFGKIGNTIYLMDEIHTPDSSRYFYADGFEERQQKGERQKQLSKEFVREWLIANNFMGGTNCSRNDR